MNGTLNGHYVDDDARWRAVLARDPAADGHFYYGVTSTRIYCRPTCPARRPRRERVVFLDSPEAAEAVGFRACLRCQPTLVSAEQQTVARVLELLDTSDPTPSLAQLGQLVGMEPTHLQRVFRRFTGLSPRAYAATRRAERLKQRLREGGRVVDAMVDAGYRSARALATDATPRLGMSPGAYRRGGAGQRITYAVVDTLIGPMLIAASPRGISTIRFGDANELIASLRAELPAAELVEDAASIEPYADQIQAYLDGAGPMPAPTLDVRGTAFQQRVWDELRRIPVGETISYQELARRIGMPTATRAVARACATNPVALLVPCHRVVGTNGKLTGYRWGVDRKRQLLSREHELAATLSSKE